MSIHCCSRLALALLGVSHFALMNSREAMAQSSGSGYTEGTRYDLGGRVSGLISPDPDGSGPLNFLAIRNSYDASGRLAKVESGELSSWQPENIIPANWTGFSVYRTSELTYDDFDRKLSETEKGSDGIAISLTQYSYDAVGRLECTAQRMNPTFYASLPASACTLGAQGTQGPDRITKNVYDAAGQLIQVRKAVGTSVEQAYTTYSYTPNGKQEYVIDANGNRAKFEYDGFDRQVKWIFPSQTAPTAYAPSTQANALATAGALNTADYEQYGYDANGNRTSLRKRDGSTLTYSYDALNRVTVKVVPERFGLAATHTRDVYYGYDLRGLQLFARFDSASGEGISNAYDGFGRLTSTTQAIDGASRTISYAYDADGNRTQLTFPDGNSVTYTYDGLDRPSTILRSGMAAIASYAYNPDGTRAGFASNGSAVSTTYGYDPAGRLSSLTNNPLASTYNNQWSFGYNPANQIVSASRTNDAFAWTGGFNVNRAYVANGLNQYTAAGSTGFTYDANGNLTSDGANTYTYDVENRLVGVSGAKTATLRYDPLGRLYEVSASTGTTRFLNGGDELNAEYDAAGNLLRRYIHGADSAADDPIAWYEGLTYSAATERLLRPDWHGSIVLVADSTGANVLAVNRYDEYGIPQSTNAGRFQYTGQAWIAELGMYYYKARMYSPTLGRFMQTDPIGYKDQVNLYAYVANDPMNRVDPAGTDSWLVSRPTPYPGAGHMFVVVTDPKTGEVVARYSFAPNGTTGQSLMFQTKLVSVTGANDNTNRQDSKAWNGIQSGNPNGASAVRIGASDSSVIAAGNKVNAATGTLEKPGSVPYTFYGTNSNAAAYAVADMAVKADGGKQGTQAVPGDQFHPGNGAYRQVEFAADHVANQQRVNPCQSGGQAPCK